MMNGKIGKIAFFCSVVNGNNEQCFSGNIIKWDLKKTLLSLGWTMDYPTQPLHTTLNQSVFSGLRLNFSDRLSQLITVSTAQIDVD